MEKARKSDDFRRTTRSCGCRDQDH